MRIFALMALIVLPSIGYTAEVKIGNDEFNNAAIFITGKIETGDFKKIEDSSRNFVNLLVKDSDQELKFILNSEGGNVEEAIKIGLLFRETLASVYVWGNRLIHESESEAQWMMSHRAKGWAEKYETQNNVIYSGNRPLTDNDFKKCYGACVLMFLGGVQKQISDNYYWIDDFRAPENKDVPVIGLQRPYFSKELYASLSASDAEVAYKELETLVRNYLNEIGVTQELIDRIFKSASNGIDLVKDAEFRKMIYQKEPFYDEWIIAKCGVFDDGKGLLSKEDFDYKNSVWDGKKIEVRRLIKIHGGNPGDYAHIYTDYIPEGYSKERYEKIMSVVRAHNAKYQDCKENAVKNHQVNFFSNTQ